MSIISIRKCERMRIQPEQAPQTYKFLSKDLPELFLETAATASDEDWTETIDKASVLLERYDNELALGLINVYLDYLDKQYRRKKRTRPRAISEQILFDTI